MFYRSLPLVVICYRSRKRRPSNSHDDGSRDALMDECNAALVLMSLSCSPHSPNIGSKLYRCYYMAV